MAFWDGEFHFTLDDQSLLRAICMVEGEATPASEESTLNRYVVEKPAFKVIKDNAHLRKLLKEFLIASIAFKNAQQANDAVKGFWKLTHPKSWKSLEAQLRDLQAVRDAKFKAYEMLRRLTDWENVLLQRVLATGIHPSSNS